MTTGDAVCDVTFMVAPVLEVELVKKTEEDEEVVAAASYLALAVSVTKTVSTWVCCLALSLPLNILPSFLRQLSDRGSDTTDASSCPFISRLRIAPVTLPPSPFPCRHHCTLQSWTTSPRFDTGRDGSSERNSSDDSIRSSFSPQLPSVNETS